MLTTVVRCAFDTGCVGRRHSYAAEQLQTYGEAQLARHHHARHSIALAVTAGGRIWDADEAWILDHLQVEHDNLRAAIEWLLENRKLDEVARIAASAWLFWWIRGFHGEAADWVARALESPGVMTLGTPWVIALAHNARARLALTEDDAATVTRVMSEGLQILAKLQDSWAIRYPLAYLATAAAMQRRPPRAAMQRRPQRAAMLHGVAEAFFERTGNVSNFPVPQRVSDRYRTEVEAQLGHNAFAELLERGRSLPVEEALAFAANDGAEPGTPARTARRAAARVP